MTIQIPVSHITERQLEFLRALCRQCSVAESTLVHEINAVRRREWQIVDTLGEMNRSQAGYAIDLMTGVRDGKRTAPVPPGQRSFFGGQ